MLRNAISAFTRVFDALWRRGALLIRGPHRKHTLPLPGLRGSRRCGAACSTLHRVRDTWRAWSLPHTLTRSSATSCLGRHVS